VTLTKALDDGQPSVVDPGGLVRYKLQVQCSSLVADCGGTVQDQLDPRLQYVSVSAPGLEQAFDQDSNTLALSGFRDGESVEIVLTARVAPGTDPGVIPNAARWVVPDQDDVVTDPVEVTVNAGATDAWHLWKSVLSPSSGNPAALGQPVSYAVSLSDSSTNAAAIIGGTVVDTYPAGATVVSCDGCVVDPAAHTLTWTITDRIVPNQDWSRIVVLSYDAPTFATPSTVRNCASANATFNTGASAPVRQYCVDVDLSDQIREVSAEKSGPTEIIAGQPVQYEVTADLGQTNAPITGLTLTDTLPAGAISWQTLSFYFSWPPPAVDVVFQVSADSGATWTDLGTYQGTTGASSTNNGDPYPLPAGATDVRAVVANTGAETGAMLYYYVNGAVRDDAEVGDTLDECATVDADNANLLNVRQCVTSTVVAPKVPHHAIKHNFASSDAPPVPGSTFQMGVGTVHTDSGLPGGQDFYIYDLLPANLDYVATDCAVSYGTGGGEGGIWDQAEICGGWGDEATPTPTVTADYHGTGRTLLVWHVQRAEPIPYNQAYALKFTVRVADATPVGVITNTAGVLEGGKQTFCTGWGDPIDASNDPYDADSDPSTEVSCEASATVTISASAAVSAEKWDSGSPGLAAVSETAGQPAADCPSWDAYTRYPCVSQTVPGGPLSYRLRLANTGNRNLTNYVVYDVLPHIGDTGVSQSLAGQDRGSSWQPVLTGPITFAGDLPVGADPVVQYSLSSDPCRPELNAGAADGDWQGGACDSVWLTADEAAAAGWGNVRGFRISMFAAGAVWQPGEAIVVQVGMRVPPDAPLSSKDPVSLSTAWNSIAYRVFSVGSGGGTSRLLAAEARKVGTIISLDLKPVPKIEIKKYSGDWPAGQEAPDGDFDEAPGLEMAPGADQPVTFKIVNSGTETLTDVMVTDTTNDGPALTDVACDLSGLGGPANLALGQTWSGPFAVGAAFSCVGTLRSAPTGMSHSDTAAVAAVGADSHAPVADADDWNAHTPLARPPIVLPLLGGGATTFVTAGLLLIFFSVCLALAPRCRALRR